MIDWRNFPPDLTPEERARIEQLHAATYSGHVDALRAQWALFCGDVHTAFTREVTVTDALVWTSYLSIWIMILLFTGSAL